MPLGRKAVITKVVAEINRISAYNFIKNEIKKGRQSFVICPLIDISDKLGVASVKEEYLKLSKKIFPNLKVDMIHGKLKTEEKQDIMKKFKSGKTDILVSTSLVEVGVDIPNATMMIIEGADRFGLAQLHQFRGRVGRGKEQSYCFLFTESKSEKTLERLSALSKYSDGFNLSKIDLKFRGPGEVYGIAQKGFPELRVASIFDYELIKISL
jgi:ATP-dependent DNA helicase RecG